MMLNWCRYWFRWQCSMCNWESSITCFRFSFSYNLNSMMMSRYWLMLHNHLAFSFPIFHFISHLVLVMICIDLFYVDFILIFRDMMLEMIVIFAAWFACSFPSIFLYLDTHSIWMLLIELASCILSILSRIDLMIYCLDCCFGISMIYIANWLSMKI